MASHRQPEPGHDDSRVGSNGPTTHDHVAAEREDAAREQHAADTSGSTRDTGSTNVRQADHDAAHEKFGGVNLGACFFGWLVAIAVTVLLTGIVGAIVAAVSSTTSITQSEAEREAGTIGVAAAITLIVVLMLAYYAGGYVAGRMSRFDGTKQGIGVWVIGLLVTIIAIGLGAIFGSQYNILDRVQLPRIPVSTDDLSMGGIITAIAVLVLTLLAAMAGGAIGHRYHNRVDRVAGI
jgi:MFS family permease